MFEFYQIASLVKAGARRDPLYSQAPGHFLQAHSNVHIAVRDARWRTLLSLVCEVSLRWSRETLRIKCVRTPEIAELNIVLRRRGATKCGADMLDDDKR